MNDPLQTIKLLWGIREKVIEGTPLTENESRWLAKYLFMAYELEREGDINVDRTWHLKSIEKNKKNQEVMASLWWQGAAVNTDAVSEFIDGLKAKKNGKGDDLVSARVALAQKVFKISRSEARKFIADKTNSTYESVTTRDKRHKAKKRNAK